MALPWLTAELDQDIRAFAKYVSADGGEDGYHNAIAQLLRHPLKSVPVQPRAFLRTAVRRAIYKLWRHAQAEQRQVQAYSQGDGSDYLKGLNLSPLRKPQSHCRRGHELTDTNVVFMGANKTVRTCKVCRQHSKQVKEKSYGISSIPKNSETES